MSQIITENIDQLIQRVLLSNQISNQKLSPKDEKILNANNINELIENIEILKVLYEGLLTMKTHQVKPKGLFTKNSTTREQIRQSINTLQKQLEDELKKVGKIIAGKKIFSHQAMQLMVNKSNKSYSIESVLDAIESDVALKNSLFKTHSTEILPVEERVKRLQIYAPNQYSKYIDSIPINLETTSIYAINTNEGEQPVDLIHGVKEYTSLQKKSKINALKMDMIKSPSKEYKDIDEYYDSIFKYNLSQIPLSNYSIQVQEQIKQVEKDIVDLKKSIELLERAKEQLKNMSAVDTIEEYITLEIEALKEDLNQKETQIADLLGRKLSDTKFKNPANLTSEQMSNQPQSTVGDSSVSNAIFEPIVVSAQSTVGENELNNASSKQTTDSKQPIIKKTSDGKIESITYYDLFTGEPVELGISEIYDILVKMNNKFAEVASNIFLYKSFDESLKEDIHADNPELKITEDILQQYRFKKFIKRKQDIIHEDPAYESVYANIEAILDGSENFKEIISNTLTKCGDDKFNISLEMSTLGRCEFEVKLAESIKEWLSSDKTQSTRDGEIKFFKHIQQFMGLNFSADYFRSFNGNDSDLLKLKSELYPTILGKHYTNLITKNDILLDQISDFTKNVKVTAMQQSIQNIGHELNEPEINPTAPTLPE